MMPFESALYPGCIFLSDKFNDDCVLHGQCNFNLPRYWDCSESTLSLPDPPDQVVIPRPETWFGGANDCFGTFGTSIGILTARACEYWLPVVQDAGVPISDAELQIAESDLAFRGAPTPALQEAATYAWALLRFNPAIIRYACCIIEEAFQLAAQAGIDTGLDDKSLDDFCDCLTELLLGGYTIDIDDRDTPFGEAGSTTGGRLLLFTNAPNNTFIHEEWVGPSVGGAVSERDLCLAAYLASVFAHELAHQCLKGEPSHREPPGDDDFIIDTCDPVWMFGSAVLALILESYGLTPGESCCPGAPWLASAWPDNLSSNFC